jgi:hypothetical protein
MSDFLGVTNGFDAERSEILPLSGHPAPDTITSTFCYPEFRQNVSYVSLELVKRLRAMTLALLPVEVDPESLNSSMSRIITPQVIAAYRVAAGDFELAVSTMLYNGGADVAVLAPEHDCHPAFPLTLLFGSGHIDAHISSVHSYLTACCALALNLCGMRTTILLTMETTIVEVCPLLALGRVLRG